MQGKIIKNISNQYTVLTNNSEYVCKARGKFRHESLTPLVGDEVIIDQENNYILEILKRTNELKRPSIANIDYALIIQSCKKPNLSLNLLDKLLVNIIHNNIKPMICFTKLDLLSNEELEEINNIRKYYESINITTVYNTELDEIKSILKDKIVVLSGQTGAGKSTLLNKLDNSLNLKTQEISIALGRGKHTTRHVELYKIGDVYIADTPGFSSLEFNDLSKEEIRDSFIEFSKFTCPFKDCMHDKEKNCVVKDELEQGLILESRYDNYIKFIREVK